MFGQAIATSSRLAVEKLSGEKVKDSAIVVDAEPGKKGKGKKTSRSLTASPAPSAPVTGIVADVTGNNVIINKGSNHGVQPGQMFAVVKIVKEVKDPETGKVIFKKTEEIARIKITSVQTVASEGEIISGAADALKVGTKVEKVE